MTLKSSIETELTSGQFQALPHICTELQIPPSFSVTVGTQTCPLSCSTLPVSICSYFTSAYILHFSFEWLLYTPEEQETHPSDFPAPASTSQTSILWAMSILHASFNSSNYRRFSAVLDSPTSTSWSPMVIFLVHFASWSGWDSVLGKGRSHPYLASSLVSLCCSLRKACLYEQPVVVVIKKHQKSSTDATFQCDVL